MSGLSTTQVFVRPWSFDKWIPALDAALASFGRTRGCAAHGNVKSFARLLFRGPPRSLDSAQAPLGSLSGYSWASPVPLLLLLLG